MHIQIPKADGPPSQVSTDGLHTTTPTATFSTIHIYRSQMDPPVKQAQMACIPTTPIATFSTMHKYRSQMDPPVKQAQMVCIPLHLLLHLVPCIYIEVRWTPPVK